VYFCARDEVGDTETLDDWIVCAKTALTAQIVATIDNLKMLFLILRLVEVEKECVRRDQFATQRTGQLLIRDDGQRWLGEMRGSVSENAPL
jgi:hypothetical protein